MTFEDPLQANLFYDYAVRPKPPGPVTCKYCPPALMGNEPRSSLSFNTHASRTPLLPSCEGPVDYAYAGGSFDRARFITAAAAVLQSPMAPYIFLMDWVKLYAGARTASLPPAR